MAGENTFSTMEQYKESYGDKLNNVVPASSIIYDECKWDEGDKTGDSFHQSVTLTNENGFTYNGSGGAVATLKAPVQANIKDSSSTGFELIGRARISYAAASRGATTKQAFKQAWGTVLFNLRKSSMKRQELCLLRGQKGLGVVSAITSGVITITDASWSPTTWAGLEGSVLEAFTTSDATATQHDTLLTITAINYTNKTVTVSGTSTSVVPGDVLFFEGAKTTTGYNESAGIVKIAGNSGTLFGIDSTAANNGLWAGNASTSFGTPTMGRFLSAASLAVDKGLEEMLMVLVNPKSWEVLNGDLAAMRMYDGSYSKEKAENGSQRISYYGQMGELRLRSHPYLQRGESVMFPPSMYKRIGSADIGMGVPGLAGDGGRDIFFHLEATNAVEARTYSDQSLFTDGPSTSVYVSGITYP